ncbi:MAG: glycogen debranching protein GlgX, partial [Myxococcota bacterium]
WHVLVWGVGEGQVYAYRIHGPYIPEQGLRFNPRKVLLDPYARGIVYGDNWSRERAVHPDDNTASAMKSLVVDPSSFDWEGSQPPRIDPTKRIIYELHVRGYTRHPSSGVNHPGTFKGLIDKIPYIKSLGVTTVELLPIFQFDDRTAIFHHPDSGEPLRDFWGYNPLGFFAPHRGYYIEDWSQMSYLTGFRELVKAFHDAGLEVFLDVVFNHTAEGDHTGPTITFRGIENTAYYQLSPEDPSLYENFSGCGNTVNCNHPIARRMILDSLRYWAHTMHVDGFRFDLASILARGAGGVPLEAPPLTWEIESDPLLERTTLIAEAWDAAGLYQVGAFPGERWSEWNGQYRDDVRSFWRGDFGLAGRMATRLLGSPDLYERHGRQPNQCINFITCHDGFTLNDLVSYSRKHNRENGEDSRDGEHENHSHNYGVEGPTDDPGIAALRLRQIKNMLTTLFVSQGTPMLLAGDEFRRTQQGNNNAWCQDNPIGWVDWSLAQRNTGLVRFMRTLIQLRNAHPNLRRDRFLLGTTAPAAMDPYGYTRVRWHGVLPDRPDWSAGCRTVAMTLTEAADDVALHIILNAHNDAIRFWLPEPPGGGPWLKVVDTSLPTPHDIIDPDAMRTMDRRNLEHNAPYITLAGQSAVVLLQPPGFKDVEVLW